MGAASAARAVQVLQQQQQLVRSNRLLWQPARSSLCHMAMHEPVPEAQGHLDVNLLGCQVASKRLVLSSCNKQPLRRGTGIGGAGGQKRCIRCSDIAGRVVPKAGHSCVCFLHSVGAAASVTSEMRSRHEAHRSRDAGACSVIQHWQQLLPGTLLLGPPSGEGDQREAIGFSVLIAFQKVQCSVLAQPQQCLCTLCIDICGRTAAAGQGITVLTVSLVVIFMVVYTPLRRQPCLLSITRP